VKKREKNEHDGKLVEEDLDYLQYWLMVLVKLLKPTNNFEPLYLFFTTL